MWSKMIYEKVYYDSCDKDSILRLNGVIIKDLQKQVFSIVLENNVYIRQFYLTQRVDY